ncbi:THAP domain-containing protein 1 B-like [Hydra vulgaris]|uniref:THAP domain-containing protein 1 B-like n=1 Tax=Hydra vulgaris TaxID=6087 RepID=UPI0032EA59CE
MVNSCAAYGCSNRYIKGGKKSFHKFPFQNSELYKKNLILDHYHKPILKCNAVPSVFVFSTNIQKTKRKLPSIRTSVNSLSKFDSFSKKTKFDVCPVIDKPSKEINSTHNDQSESTIEQNDHTSQSPTQSIKSLSPAKEKLKKKS